MMLRAGLTDVALAIGVEKMHSDDKLKSSAIFDGGWDVHDLDAIAERLTAIGDGVSPPPGTPEGVRSPFMELYASVTRGHMRMFGTTQEHQIGRAHVGTPVTNAQLVCRHLLEK